MDSDHPVQNYQPLPETVPSTKRNNMSIPLIICLISLLIIVGVGSYTLGQRSKKPQAALVTPIISQPTLMPTALPSPTITTNTKIYNKFGISFSYPSEYSITAEGIDGQDSSCNYVELSSNIKVDATASPDEQALSIIICPLKTGDTIESFYQKEVTESEQILNKQIKNINGLNAISFDWKNNSGQGSGQVILLLGNQSKVRIYKTPIITSRQSEFENLLNTITIN
jgi:hypothetical protein